MLKIKRVFGSLYDLFFGNDGWTDWTRVSIKSGQVLHVAGKIRSKEVMDALLLKQGR